MTRLYDYAGKFCGNADPEVQVPPGYWLRADDSPDSLSSLEFLDWIGPVRFAAVWQAAQSNAAVAFAMMRGLAAQSVYISESLPILFQLEQLGLLPQGTALEIWA